MARLDKFTVEQMVAAIHGSKGIKTVVAQRLGCDWDTVTNYCKRYVTVAKALQMEREALVDLAEGKLTQAVSDGEWPAISFVLRTLGKERGWVERQEVSGASSAARVRPGQSVTQAVLQT